MASYLLALGNMTNYHDLYPLIIYKHEKLLPPPPPQPFSMPTSIARQNEMSLLSLETLLRSVFVNKQHRKRWPSFPLQCPQTSMWNIHINQYFDSNKYIALKFYYNKVQKRIQFFMVQLHLFSAPTGFVRVLTPQSLTQVTELGKPFLLLFLTL